MIEEREFAGLRSAFRARGEVDDRLYRLLGGLARSVARRLPPAYSPSGRWDTEAYEDALHDWIETRLLRRGDLLAAFDRFEDPDPFLGWLRLNFRHHLENQRERGELGNLISRSGALMRTDQRFHDWVAASKPSSVWWGLAEWQAPQPYQGSDQALLAHAWALGEIKLFRYSREVERASPILSTAALSGFLTGLFERAEGLLTIGHLAAVLRRRFDLGPPPVLEIIPAIAEEIEEVERADEAAITSAVRAVRAELSQRQLEAVLARSEAQTLDQVAARLGVARGTVDNDLRAAAAEIDKHCAEGVRREDLVEKLLDSLS